MATIRTIRGSRLPLSFLADRSPTRKAYLNAAVLRGENLGYKRMELSALERL